MPTNRPTMGRYDSSVEGWSAVDKVAQFSHAVGRVSGGRGSAILIAVIDNQGQLIDTATETPISRLRSSGSSSPRSAMLSVGAAGALRYNDRSLRDSFRSVCHGSVNSMEQTTCTDDPWRARETKQPPLGVLLTTSHVLCIPEEAEDATVTFLDQPGTMTSVSLGHNPKPMRVPLRGAYGFVTSAAEANEYSAKYRRGIARGKDRHNNDGSIGGPSQESYRNEPDYLLYRCQDASSEDSVEDVGFTLTFCDIFPEPAETTNSTMPSKLTTPLRRSRFAGGGLEVGVTPNGPNRGTSPQTSSVRSSNQGLNLNGSGSARYNPGNPLAEDSSTPLGRHSVSSEAASLGGVGLNENTLLVLQPLPVPLLLSVIPDVKVGDAHLMITHVNNGRRCYRVQHVAAVHPDFCEYTLTNVSEDECSGGPVFNSAGDFIGVQHERCGHSICLLIKSIVRNLFVSDLLGMCRSPVSEVSAAVQHDLHGGRCEEVVETASVVHSTRASLKRGVASPKPSSLPETAARAPCANAATTIKVGERGSGDHVASTASPLPLISAVKKPLSQQVPSYEAVFKEFYSGFDSLSHILYAFPYSRQLLKLALENLSQLRYGTELDQMSVMGGVGAILETIDGYPQDEAIVSGALSAMCRICIHERNLRMFLHLDGVVTTMEVMKEYVHQPTVLQWGMYLLMSATDASLASAPQCAEMIVQCRGPQLCVNVLRVHGVVQRKSAVRQLQHNRLIRWTCDLIANLLVSDPQRTTLFLHEDFLTLLLQLLHDYSGNLFLTEGVVHVFCVFVMCFADLDVKGGSHDSDAQHVSQTMLSSPEPKKLALPGDASAYLSPPERLMNAQLSAGSGGTHLAPMGFATPHKVSFFFLCQAVAGDTENRFLRGLLDVCGAAMDAKSAVTAHRGRPEGVLLQCFETLRLLLSWGLIHLYSRCGASNSMPATEESFSSLAETLQAPSVTSLSLQMSAPCEELLQLWLLLETLRETMPSASVLQTQLSAVEKLVQQQG